MLSSVAVNSLFVFASTEGDPVENSRKSTKKLELTKNAIQKKNTTNSAIKQAWKGIVEKEKSSKKSNERGTYEEQTWMYCDVEPIPVSYLKSCISKRIFFI